MATSTQETGHSPRQEPGEVTRWLEQLALGDGSALDRLVPLLYDEMRQLARSRLRAERPDHTLSPTALVHETYFRLLDQRSISAATRLQFFGAASRTMRRVLVDHARTRNRRKRGGGEALLPLPEAGPLLTEAACAEVLALDEALTRLEQCEPRVARMVELKFWSGLSFEEIAGLLGISTKTVQRDWRAARAWLRKEVRGEAAGDVPRPGPSA
ncbi:MAG TPA: ECF-type sigma factor [Thermoanaerobaculia bacterium]|nr:ECF-type sigma factor [Thermoanaerobaculia bacterium]